MTASRSAAPQDQANLAIDQLRRSQGDGRLATDVTFAPGVVLNADPALGLAGTWRSPPGRLLELEAAPTGTGDWCAIHIPLGALAIGDLGVIGFTCRSAAPTPVVVRACLRSGLDGGFEDHFFDRHILAHAADTLHVDVLDLHRSLGIPDQADWRDFILFLPVFPFHLSLQDLRLFLV